MKMCEFLELCERLNLFVIIIFIRDVFGDSWMFPDLKRDREAASPECWYWVGTRKEDVPKFSGREIFQIFLGKIRFPGNGIPERRPLILGLCGTVEIAPQTRPQFYFILKFNSNRGPLRKLHLYCRAIVVTEPSHSNSKLFCLFVLLVMNQNRILLMLQVLASWSVPCFSD